MKNRESEVAAMRASAWLVLVAAGLMWVVAGCVKAPERIEVNVGHDRPAPVDSSRIPETSSYDDCRAELVKAYQNLQYQERENARLEEKAAKYKKERDEYKKQLKKYEHD